MLDCLDDAAVRRWCAAGLAALRRHQVEIDQLNVFPVPDGDTGTNLVLTVTSAWDALAHESAVDGPGRVLQQMARGALLGARGSSGVIVSQILRGTADALAAAPAARGRAMASALSAAAKAAYGAVAEPVEGTVLSVVRAAAAAAVAANSDDLGAVVGAAAKAAAAALARTPEQLPALARAGVVDAGGRGLVVLLDALVEVVTGQATVTAPLTRIALNPRLLTVARETGSIQYAYEVQYLLDAAPAAVEGLKHELGGLGDSLVVVGTAVADEVPTWNVHVHVNDVGAALEAGVRAGRPHRISVTRFADQMAESRAFDEEARGVVVVAGGTGLTQVYSAEGAIVVDGGPTNNPSTADLLDAIRATGAGRVVVLPNDANVHAVAATAAEEARAGGIRVAVVPTRSPVQGLAAIAVRDASRRFHDDVIAMAEAAGACRYAEVTFATRAALTVAGRCEAGDVLGLVEGEVNLIGQSLEQSCRSLLDRMLAGGGELVTLVLGADCPAGLGEALTRHLAEHWPFVQANLIAGGQAHYPLLVGVE